MNKLMKLINSFINEEITVNNYISLLDELDKEDFKLIYEINSTTNMDKLMISILICYIYKNEFIDLNNNFNNPYLSYIKHIFTSSNELYNNENVFVKNKEVLFNDDYLVIKVTSNIEEVTFIINPTNDEIEINLPIELANRSLFCLNCNDYFDVEDKLIVPDLSFYSFCKPN